MKIAIKVFLILGMVGSSIECLSSFISAIVLLPVDLVEASVNVVLAIFNVGAIIMCSLSLYNINKFGIAMAVCTLIFGNLIAGILMLCEIGNRKQNNNQSTQYYANQNYYNQHGSAQYNNPYQQQTTNIDPFVPDENYDEKQQQLKRLNDLYVAGAITQQEYFEKRNEILSK